MEIIESKLSNFFYIVIGCVGILGLVLVRKLSDNFIKVCGNVLGSIMMVIVGFFVAVNHKMWVYDDRIEWIFFTKKKNIVYKRDMKGILFKNVMGSYWMVTKDNRMFLLFFPFCKKKIQKMCEDIKKQYPDFEIR